MPLKKLTLGLTLTSLLSLYGCDDNDNNSTKQSGPVENIVTTTTENDNFSTLAAAIEQAELTSTLQSDGPFTVFAPTDTAFNQYLDTQQLTADDLLASPALGDILTYHVLSSEVMAQAAIDVASSEMNQVVTVNGAKIAVSAREGDLYINQAKVLTADVDASNGVIHAIDHVLIQPSDSALSDTTLSIAGLVSQLADGDSAEFTILLQALQTAGLVGALSDTDSNYTVFAPTDKAFNDFLSGAGISATDLLNNPDLLAILQQHVIGNAAIDLISAYAANGKEVATLRENTSLSVSIMDGQLLIEGSPVVIANVKTANGIIHVIDKVITSVN